jgi:integrase
MPYRCPKMETKMASIYTKTNKNGSISYYGTLNINGKRHRKLLGYDKKTAQTQLSRIEYELKFAPQPKKKPRIAFNKSYISFLKDIELSGVSKKQMEGISRSVNRLKKFADGMGIGGIDEILPEHLKEIINSRSKERVVNKYYSHLDDYCPKVSITTLNKDIQNIKRFFKYCLEMKWIKEDPSTGLKYFKKSSSVERYSFTDEELRMIMKNAGRYYDFYYLLLHTGIRATDAYLLEEKHIEDDWLKIKMRKTGDMLEIPISKDVIDVLKLRIDSGLLFPELQSSRQRNNCVKMLQRNFSIDFVRNNNINLHTFRHTYAHTMLNKGVPKEVLQTLLGHRSIRTTEIYANWVRKEELEKWV